MDVSWTKHGIQVCRNAVGAAVLRNFDALISSAKFRLNYHSPLNADDAEPVTKARSKSDVVYIETDLDSLSPQVLGKVLSPSLLYMPKLTSLVSILLLKGKDYTPPQRSPVSALLLFGASARIEHFDQAGQRVHTAVLSPGDMLLRRDMACNELSVTVRQRDVTDQCLRNKCDVTDQPSAKDDVISQGEVGKSAQKGITNDAHGTGVADENGDGIRFLVLLKGEAEDGGGNAEVIWPGDDGWVPELRALADE